MIKGLLDERNSALFNELIKTCEIEVELVNHTQEYECYSINNSSKIYVPESNICPDSFTHELLHIFLRSKDIFIGARLKRKIHATKTLSKIYSEPLLEHIGNCLDHIKILPIYLELGFDRRKFLYDYEINKCTSEDINQIKQHWKKGFPINAQIIDFYLGKYFAAKACPNENFNYVKNLQMLEEIDEKLFFINETLVKRWAEMKMNQQNELDDNYKSIAEDYIKEMKAWSATKFL